MEQAVKAFQAIIDQASRIVFFGGAGVSTESGIPDFRSADGLYNQTYRFPPETILSRSFFDTHPADFFAFYRDKMLPLQAKPNAAHRALAKLEEIGKLSAVVTQNIDGLHQAAGSKRVFELHGSIHRNRCMQCGKAFDAGAIAESTGVPRCSCGGIIKPDVVLYEEPLDDAVVEGAVRAISRADTLIIAGTSLRVYPAAGLVRWFRGAHLVNINLDANGMQADGCLHIPHPVGTMFEKITIGDLS